MKPRPRGPFARWLNIQRRVRQVRGAINRSLYPNALWKEVETLGGLVLLDENGKPILTHYQHRDGTITKEIPLTPSGPMYAD